MLYAEIKKKGRRASQRGYHLDDNGKFVPFEVTINDVGVKFGQGAVKGGVGGNYHFEDVILYVKDDDGNFIKVK